MTERERTTERAPLADAGAGVLVSVAMTAFNHAPYVAEAVTAALAQRTDFAFEVIVGDDCSTDGTRDVLHALQRRAPERLRLVLPERNMGGGGKRLFERTLAAARGAYIATMDADDYWTSPHKLQRQVEFLRAHPECAMCFHDVLEVWQDGTRPPRRTNAVPPPTLTGMRDILRANYIPACSPMFVRAVLCPLPRWYFDVDFGDWTLYVLAAELGRIGYIGEVMGVYRQHRHGVWGSLDEVRRFERLVRFYDELDAATQFRYAHWIEPARTQWLSMLAQAYARHDQPAKARRAAWETLRTHPMGGEFSRREMLRTLVRGRAAPVAEPSPDA